MQDAESALKSLSFYLPLDLAKADDPENRDAQGYASTEDLDEEGEQLAQKSLNWDYYNRSGIWTDNHAGQRKGTSIVAVAAPLCDATFHPGQGWFVKGRFLDTDRGNYWLEAGRALKKAGDQRRLALSVEGFYRSPRMAGVPLAADIVNVAVTHNPVNTSKRCTLELLGKALGTADVSPMVREDLEGARRKKSEALRRLVEFLATQIQKTRRLSHQAALRIALGFVKRTYAH